ncbi:MAG: Holliday junction resolvase RuvX [Gammaproteobacteria bacterium]|nr:Holliday junction resolvase RuvX [Gammaproteobacteria bacterium]
MSAAAGRPSAGTVIAFDFGLRRIGIAVGEIQLRSASGLKTINARQDAPDWDAIAAVLKEWQPATLVVGLPRYTDGSDSTMATAARDFADQLSHRFNIPVEMIDESLTSRAADAELVQLRRDGVLGRKISRDDSDRVAARLILESWMNQPQSTG